VPSPSPKNIIFFQKKLLAWFDLGGRSFPWRKKKLTQYQIVISEVLLQRTRADTVSKFYVEFIQDFPNWHSLALAKIESIEEYLRPIGLYKQRATRLKKLAEEMVRRNGQIPRQREILESIPFMGQYIANAVQLVIHGERLPLLDVNMARVLERFFRERKMADIRYDPYLQSLALQYADHPMAKELNWAILDFAAMVCKARNPKCNECLLAIKCTFYNNSY
jgi:A/G-specific adenine glycosylase